ncbi:hypothetical protein PBY51_006242 [Eleginops maclovinus]|nr:hypothetical protein PBY51_006242 [Eleginops maclovinus]
MFEGREGHRNLALDFRALREDKYFYAGTAIALSLVHGGPPPCFLSKTLFTGISEGADQCQPELEDVTDSDLRDKLTKVSEATTLHDLQLSVEPISDYLATAGCLRLLTSLTDKYPLLEDILMFHVVHRVRAPLERFKDGLKTLGVLPKIQQHPEAFRPLLCYNPPTLTADSLDCLFTINWSEDGSNSRIGENKTVAFWRDFLQDVEEEKKMTLESILTFTTGSNVVPPMGFSPQPSLEFLHGGGKYPIANTCINCLRLPLHSEYEPFKEAMEFAIQNTYGFGMA